MGVKMMKVAELTNVIEHVRGSGIMDKKLPVNVLLCLQKNLIELESAYDLVNKQRLDICRSHSEMENGEPKLVDGNYAIKKEEQEAFNKEMLELFQSDLDLDVKKISAEQLEACDANARYDALTANDILALGFMIE